MNRSKKTQNTNNSIDNYPDYSDYSDSLKVRIKDSINNHITDMSLIKHKKIHPTIKAFYGKYKENKKIGDFIVLYQKLLLAQDVMKNSKSINMDTFVADIQKNIADIQKIAQADSTILRNYIKKCIEEITNIEFLPDINTIIGDNKAIHLSSNDITNNGKVMMALLNVILKTEDQKMINSFLQYNDRSSYSTNKGDAGGNPTYSNHHIIADSVLKALFNAADVNEDIANLFIINNGNMYSGPTCDFRCDDAKSGLDRAAAGLFYDKDNKYTKLRDLYTKMVKEFAPVHPDTNFHEKTNEYMNEQGEEIIYRLSNIKTMPDGDTENKNIKNKNIKLAFDFATEFMTLCIDSDQKVTPFDPAKWSVSKKTGKLYIKGLDESILDEPLPFIEDKPHRAVIRTISSEKASDKREKYNPAGNSINSIYKPTRELSEITDAVWNKLDQLNPNERLNASDDCLDFLTSVFRTQRASIRFSQKINITADVLNNIEKHENKKYIIENIISYPGLFNISEQDKPILLSIAHTQNKNLSLIYWISNNLPIDKWKEFGEQTKNMTEKDFTDIFNKLNSNKASNTTPAINQIGPKKPGQLRNEIGANKPRGSVFTLRPTINSNLTTGQAGTSSSFNDQSKDTKYECSNLAGQQSNLAKSVSLTRQPSWSSPNNNSYSGKTRSKSQGDKTEDSFGKRNRSKDDNHFVTGFD